MLLFFFISSVSQVYYNVTSGSAFNFNNRSSLSAQCIWLVIWFLFDFRSICVCSPRIHVGFSEFSNLHPSPENTIGVGGSAAQIAPRCECGSIQGVLTSHSGFVGFRFTVTLTKIKAVTEDERTNESIDQKKVCLFEKPLWCLKRPVKILTTPMFYVD